MGSCDVVVADPAPLMGDISERAEQSKAEGERQRRIKS